MNQGSAIGLSAMTVLGVALLAGNADSQQNSLNEQLESLKVQLVGTWTLVSYERVFPDGHAMHEMGANPKGINIFEPDGHYVLIIASSGSANKASTPAEDQVMTKLMAASYGTYTVDVRGGNRLGLREDFSSLHPTLVGADTERIITSLTPNQLNYTIPEPFGEAIHVEWTRAAAIQPYSLTPQHYGPAQ